MKNNYFKGSDFAQAFCTKENEHKEMDVALLAACADIANKHAEKLEAAVRDSRVVLDGVSWHGAWGKYTEGAKQWLEKYSELAK